MKFSTEIRLTDSDPVGEYQLALINDDGAVIYGLDDDQDQGRITGNKQILLDNDGIHSSKFLSSPSVLRFNSRSIGRSIELDYFQGPAAHIALILLWRFKQPGSKYYDDPVQGWDGNEQFYHIYSNQTRSTPTAVMNGLLSRGWSIIPPNNYWLPKSFDQNILNQIHNSDYDPCANDMAGNS